MVSRKESPYGAIFTNNPLILKWPKRCVHRCLCSVQHFGKKIMNLITKFKFMNVYSRHFTADLIRYVVSDMAVLASLRCVNVIWSKWGIE